ncbi:MAG: hypothetical protein VYB54_07415 [Pseudomonadota bacterium]|nr:hypothetical protein [Pseudomonadota bacterium]
MDATNMPPLERAAAEAEALGLPVDMLVSADLARFRRLAEAATPKLDEWAWDLLDHVLSGGEQADILGGHVDLPGTGTILAGIDEWADGADYAHVERAGALARKVAGWSPLAVAGVLMRLRLGRSR